MPVIRKDAADIKDRIWLAPVVYTLYKVLHRHTDHEQYVKVTDFLADEMRPGLFPWKKAVTNYTILPATGSDGKPISVKEYLSRNEIVITDAFWTCRCESKFIRFARKPVCEKCGCKKEDATRRVRHIEEFLS